MLKLYPKQLKEKFVSAMQKATGFEYEEGNPFLIKTSQISYLVYLKNLSPAYFRNSPDITRIQLPYLAEFEGVLQNGISLIALGYDTENDVYISWNPARIFQRINSRVNVSLYSRISVQTAAKHGGFKKGVLSTGEVFVGFDRIILPDFFNNISNLFADNAIDCKETRVSPVESLEILTEISDPVVINKITPLLRESKILEAATTCYEHYGSRYVNMRVKDWLAVAKNMYMRIEEQ